MGAQNSWMRVGLTMVVGAGVSGPAFGQFRKPDAPPVSGDATYQVDMAKWSRSYERAGYPPMLVLAGIATPATSGNGVGASLSTVDASGDGMLLKREIERVLLDNADTEIVNLDALTDMDKREADLLLLNHEREAVELLATKLNASLAIVTRLQPANRAGVKYRVTVDAIDVPRARTVSTLGFDWELGDDARQVKRYARLIAQDFVERYDRYWTGDATCNAHRFSVRLLHTDTVELGEIRELIQSLPRVASANVGQRQSAGGSSVSQINVVYAGEPFDFVTQLQRTLRQGYGLDIEATDVTTGTITIAPAAGVWALESRTPPEMGTIGSAGERPTGLTFMKVIVSGFEHEADALAFGDALRENVIAIDEIGYALYEVTPEGGRAQFDASYVGGYDALVRDVIGATARVPFKTDLAVSDPHTLVLRVR